MQRINKTRFVKISGPSGAGKTTKLKSHLLKRRFLNMESIYLPQSLALPTHSLKATLFTKQISQKSRNFLANLGKKHLIDIICSDDNLEHYKLSGGEVQLVKLASVLDYRQVIVADEPFSALDDGLRHNVEEYLCKELVAKMFLFTSHQAFTGNHCELFVKRLPN